MRTTAAVRGGTRAITRAGERLPAKDAAVRGRRWVWRAALVLLGIGSAAQAVSAQQTAVPDQNHFVVILDTSGTTWRSLPESDFGAKRARMADLVAGSVFDALATPSGLLPPFRPGRDVISLLPVGLPQYASKDELRRPPSFRDSYVSDAYAQLRLRDRGQLRDAIRNLDRWSYWSVIEAAIPLAVDFLGREQPSASMPLFRHTILVIVSDRRLNKDLEQTTDEIRHLEAANRQGFPDAEKIRDFDYLHRALAVFSDFWLSGVPQHSRYLVTTSSLSTLIQDDGVSRWFSDAYPLKIYVTELLPAPRPEISFSQLFTPVYDVVLQRRAGRRYDQDLTVAPRALTVGGISLSPLALEWSLNGARNSRIASGSSPIARGPAQISLKVDGNAEPAGLELTGWFDYSVPSYRGQLVAVRQSVRATKEGDLMVAPGVVVSEEMMQRASPGASQEEVRQAESVRRTRNRGILAGVIVAVLAGIAIMIAGRYPRPKLQPVVPDHIEPVSVSLDDPVRQPVVLGRIRVVNLRTKPFAHKGPITVEIHSTVPNGVSHTGSFLALSEQGKSAIKLHTDGLSETLPLIAFPAALTDVPTSVLTDSPEEVRFSCSLSWISDRRGHTKPFDVVAVVRPRQCLLRAEFVPAATAIEYDRDATVDLGSLRITDESRGAFHIPFDCAVALSIRSGKSEIAPILTPAPDAATLVVVEREATHGDASDADYRGPNTSIANIAGNTPFRSATLAVSCRLKELPEPFRNPVPLSLSILVRRGAQQLTVAENTADFTLHPNLQEPRLSIHLRTGTGLEVPLQRVPNGVVQTMDQFETIWIDPRRNQQLVLLAMIEVGNAARNGDGTLDVRVSIHQLAEGQAPAPLVLREERENQYTDSKLLASEQAFQWDFKNGSNPARLSLFIDPSELTPLQPATLTLKTVRLNIVAHSGASNDGESVALLLQPIRIGRMPRPEVVSLDFGTSAVAAMYGSVGNSQESAINLRQQEVLNQDPDDFGERGSNFIPSVIYADGKELHFPATLAELHNRPDRIIAFLKKFVASNVDRIVIENTSFAVDDLLLFAYSSLLSDRGFLGSALDDGWWKGVQRIVLTHPNSFQLEHLTRFRKAINEARPQLRVVEFVPEADAVAYYAASRLLQNDDFGRKPSLLLLVYDIGAGTLDLALRRITKDERGHIQSIAKVAENTINGAGNELDAAIARYVDDLLRREVQDPAGKRAGLEYRFPLIGGPVGSKSDRRTRAAFLTDTAMAIAQFKREVSDQYELGGATNSFELPLPVQSEQHLLSVPRGTSLGEYFSSRGSAHDVRFKGNRVNVLVKLDALEASDAMQRFIERHVDMALQSVLVVDHQGSVGVEWPDAILFSGRTARWPAIQRHVQHWFGRMVKRRTPPKVIEFSETALLKESVARGAILWASRDSIRLEGRSDLPGIFGVVSRDRSGTFAWCPLFGGETERYEISPDGTRVPVFQGEALLQANPLVEVRIVCSYNRAPLHLVSQLNGGRVPLSILEDGIYFKTFETFDEKVIREQVVQERSQTLNVSVQTIYERSTRRIALRCDLGTRRGPLRSLVRDQTIRRLEELWPYSELGTLVHQGSAP